MWKFDFTQTVEDLDIETLLYKLCQRTNSIWYRNITFLYLILYQIFTISCLYFANNDCAQTANRLQDINHSIETDYINLHMNKFYLV